MPQHVQRGPLVELGRALRAASYSFITVTPTGAALVDGVDRFRRAVEPVCLETATSFRYRELDPDVFGEEIEQNDAYADVDRIAAVALVVMV